MSHEFITDPRELLRGQAELREVMESDPHRPERLVSEIRKAIAELPTIHPEGTREHHCDLVHRDRLVLILGEQS